MLVQDARDYKLIAYGSASTVFMSAPVPF